jgi:uncharacterized protein (TIGR02145 family)
MYTSSAVNPSTETVTLNHACALLRLKLNLPSVVSPERVYISAWKPVFAESVTLTYNADGSVSKSIGEKVSTISCSLMEFDGAQTSLTAYIMTPAVDDFDGLLCKVSVEDEYGNIYSYVHNLSASGSNPDGGLNGGEVYTFEPASALQLDRWAGSNIYWDATNKKLAFEQNPYEMGKTASQGLYFKWGGTAGIAPVASEMGGSVYAYNDMGSATEGYQNYSDIPYDKGDADLSGVNTETQTGDVCTHINPVWRLPSKDEWEELLAAGTPGNITGSEEYTAEGTGSLYDGILFSNLVYLPKSGYMNVIATIDYESMMYWSKTKYSTSNAYHFQGSGATMIGKTIALPIRCIKKTAEE